MSERVTMSDVAALAGVSAATVSRVLAGNYPTATSTRARVMRAVHELDYVPDAYARGLASGGRKTVAVITTEVTSPFYAAVAQGVEAEAAAMGRLSLICQTGGDPARELTVVQLMREQRAELVVLVGGVVEDDAYRDRIGKVAKALSSAGSRLVLCGRPAPANDIPALVVEYDNEAGAHAITSFLLAAGHRSIVHLGHVPGSSTSEQRAAGYRRALAEFGLPPDAARVVPSGFGRERNVTAMHQLLGAGNRPEFAAVFAADDEVAAGAIRGLRDRGLDVPDDVSVVGYNDDRFSQDLDPPLTTVHIPAEQLGRTAVRIALGPRSTSEDHVGPERQERQVLGTHIVVRKSVANLRPTQGTPAD